MKNWHRIVMAGAWALAVATAGAQDWPQWRGPNRDGVCPEATALAETWPASGLQRLWVSENIPGGPAGGFSSPVVAGGRVYLYANLKYSVPLATRKVPEGVLRNLGWVPADKLPPAPLLDSLEQARLGEARAALAKNPKDLGPWVDQWLKDHLTDPQRTSFGGFCADRLRKGPGAFRIEDLQKLTALKDHEFASVAEFDGALDAAGIPAALRAAVVKGAIASQEVGKDALYCLDAADGKTLWCRQYDKVPGRTDVWTASSSTPCIADGRCYFAGADGALYCLNARDGTEVWATRYAAGIQNSSPLATDGLVVLLSDPAYAVQAADGKLVWKQPKAATRQSSAVAWTCAGKNYLLGNSDGDLHCLDAASGALVWGTPGRGNTTVVLAGDLMVAQSGSGDIGLAGYRLTATAAQKLWHLAVGDRGASPIIHAGYVYAVAGGVRALCVGLEDGKVAWDQKVGGGEISSPVLADGKLYALVDGGQNLVMLRAAPAKFELLGKATVGALTCTSPALAAGRLYLRLNNAVACYDLTGTAPPAAPAHPAAPGR
jgi:outer membrane protein assembly factor BamB